MNAIGRFWRQPCRRYRNFQIVFTILTLNFLIPATSYALAPDEILKTFLRMNELLGGDPYTFNESGSRLWRYLGAANVMTLGLMCLLLQLNLRRYRPVLLPLTFLKAYNATLFLFGWFAAPGYPALVGVAVFDFLTAFLFVFFARRAHAEIEARPGDELTPRPLSSR